MAAKQAVFKQDPLMWVRANKLVSFQQFGECHAIFIFSLYPKALQHVLFKTGITISTRLGVTAQ